ncbi:VOC family protein [Labrys sp. La1]|uniref:VOC family protein n=1 Tax=Labrys sp. La1 TaxID=3404917 RepID=UPI003EC04308
MTGIRTGDFVPAERRGNLGVHSLDHFVLQVPDGTKAREFYELFGLEVREEGNALQLRTFGNDHVWGTVIEGSAQKKLHHLSFGAYAEDMPRFKAHLEGLGIRLMDSPPGFASNGFWFVGHDEVLIEIKAAPKTSLDQKSAGTFVSVPAGQRGSGLGHADLKRIRPSRLAHCLVFSSDVDGAIRYYERVAGLRLSDRSGGIVAFLHGIHGSDHHLIAFAKSNGPGLHHCSWDVGAIEQIGRGALFMADKGYERGWGVGRHTIGSNYFHYVQDPWGGFSEYSCDIDYIPKGTEWDTREFAPEDALMLWGPTPPDDFVHNYEMDR